VRSDGRLLSIGPILKGIHDSLVAGSTALVVRVAVVAWALSQGFPPIGDGHYYSIFAERLAHGQGYTWLWDDGTITYAAHYPVGYPALISVFYMLFGVKAAVPMVVNAILGSLGVVAAHRLALMATTERRALYAALAVALHPAIVLYTPAFMTEGATFSLLLIAAAIALGENKPWLRAVLAGLVMGLATLVRPQCLLLTPLLAFCAVAQKPKKWPDWVRAGSIVALSIVVCLPWTARNCDKMKRCSLVSVNGGWNLAIGTQTKSGAWEELVVPESCKTVWDEAGKDACFEREAKATIVAHPLAWAKRAPAKLSSTLDYFGAGPWYLHASNATAFSDRSKLIAGTIETIASRALLLAALLSFAFSRGISRGRRALAAIGGAFSLSPPAWIAYGVLAVCVALDPKRHRVHVYCALVIAATMATHAIFFGAGRYGLVVAPFVALLALRQPRHGDIV
jgi:Dolichyl-phosphate-mannose-protein mannosyltransferase